MKVLYFVIGCSGAPKVDDSGSESKAVSGALELGFQMDTDYMALMEEPPQGNFYGAFWYGDEVSSIGPEDGAISLGSIFVENVVLPEDGSATPPLFVQTDLPIEEVVVLGFLDSDGNADPSNPSPDSKDPVTLPNENDFDVIGDETITATVYFGFLNP
jgi:hypothetical protein